MAAPSLAEDREFSPDFAEAYLRNCYSHFDELVSRNVHRFDSRDDAVEGFTYLCGKVLTSSKDVGVGLIILNMYNESENF
jgi:hypothetical protein